MRKDLKCSSCFENEAFYLLYFQKIYPSGKRGFYNPMLLCKDCATNFKQTKFEHQAIFKTFLELGKQNIKFIMWLCSEKGKEHNDLAFKIWRKRLFEIFKIWEGNLKCPLFWGGM